MTECNVFCGVPGFGLAYASPECAHPEASTKYKTPGTVLVLFRKLAPGTNTRPHFYACVDTI